MTQKVELAIGEIDRSILELRACDEVGPLKVALPQYVASHWLIPRLPRIRFRHPDLEVQVIAEPRLVDLRAERIDLAIRFGPVPHLGYAVTRLMDDRIIPVCTPNLLGRRQVDDLTLCSRCRRWTNQQVKPATVAAVGGTGSLITAGRMRFSGRASSSATLAC